jgi:PelA/Pel-15E family pectate lyase
LPGALTGDRHTARYAPDGRLFISFRDTTLESSTQGDWVGWVGRYEDITQSREGQYRVRLMDNHHRWDCAYPGVEVLPDGTMVATTYGHWTAGESPYIVSVRFNLAEIDGRAASSGSDAALRSRALEALRRGVSFFRGEVAVQGTYLWQYSEDLEKREGEGVATKTRGWIQPPGTPSVGMAYLDAYAATGEQGYLAAARETARGLLRGQLESGGWTYSVEFDTEARSKHAYREAGGKGGRNVTTLDDDTTQSALRFLIRLDETLSFGDAAIHEAVRYGIGCLLRAQYPNGAWPQGYHEFPDPARFPVIPASYPESWSRTWPGSQQYWQRYTFNDQALADTIDLMFEAARVYGRGDEATSAMGERCRAGAVRAAGFILLAQMPEPQPAWAQQYDVEMHPAWARKFEPPSVTGGETQGILEVLLRVYRQTGDHRYLEPVPRALEYLRRSRLADGRLARFYELRSNRPLYFTRDYALVHDDADLPTHYSFKVSDRTETIAREYERLRGQDSARFDGGQKRSASATPSLRREVERILQAQDDRGRWIEPGRLRYHGESDTTERIIRSATFCRNVATLSRYLGAVTGPDSRP